MRQAINLSLIVCLALTPVMQARAQAAFAQTQTQAQAQAQTQAQTGRLTRLAEPKKMKDAVAKAAVARPVEFAVGIGHGLLFIMTIAGIDLVYQEIKSQGLSPSAVAPAKLAEIAGKVGTEVVNNGQILTSLVSATAFATVSQKPAEVLTKLLADPVARKRLSQVISSSIVSSIAFLGWELGAQLWTEASLLIEDQADYQRLQSAFGMGKGAFRALLTTQPSESDANDLRIARMMVSNVMTILFYDRNLLGQWFNNTWRLKVMTGEFTTFLGLTLAGSAIGSTILPIGGTFVGFMFGFTAALAVPHSVNDSISFGYKRVRAAHAKTRLNSADYYLGQALSAEVPDQAKQKQVNDVLVSRGQTREAAITASIEQIHLAFKILQSDKYGRSARRDARAKFHDAVSQIDSLYTSEATTIESFIARLGAQPRGVSELLEAQLSRVRGVGQFWRESLQEMKSRIGTDDEPLTAEQVEDATLTSLLKFVENLHLRGFTEQSVL